MSSPLSFNPEQYPKFYPEFYPECLCHFHLPFGKLTGSFPQVPPPLTLTLLRLQDSDLVWTPRRPRSSSGDTDFPSVGPSFPHLLRFYSVLVLPENPKLRLPLPLDTTQHSFSVSEGNKSFRVRLLTQPLSSYLWSDFTIEVGWTGVGSPQCHSPGSSLSNSSSRVE